ncbi:peroxidase family protein [Candidatus Poriferisodalis sp.]|uniref:peroxidase family protein n=1 Tax=Candidatus Poriferisodalis sp. TaxID=3101277 RepID=UPI003AF7A3BC
MRDTVPLRRLLVLAAGLAVLLTLAAPPPHSLALSADSQDSTTPQWVTTGGSVLWEADLTVGGDGDSVGYSETVGGSLTDTDFSWGETDYAVTSVLLVQPGSDSGTASVSMSFDPELPEGSGSLRLQIGDVGFNLADGSVDAGEFTWPDVDADWESGDIVALSLNELPENLEPRALDGRRNNLVNPTWGMAGTTLLKKASNSYADGVSTPTTSRPNARTISNLVFAQHTSVPNFSQASDIVWQWGQFLDHDITLSLDNTAEPLPIAVPADDPVFDPLGTGEATIGLSRSVSDPETGTNAENPRRQVNAITAFIDGSQVYGSDRVRASALRTNDGTGKLKTSSDGRFLPYNDQGLGNEGGAHRPTLFVAGDVRVNEQIGLTAMHTLFVREHNRLAGIIATQNPDLSGDETYELARKIVGAQIQNITFSEFLPLLLGPDAFDAYSGYDPDVDPTIASEFSAAAYRVGHTLLSPKLNLLDADGESEKISLASSFFSPSFYNGHGISEVLRGFAAQQAQDVDSQVINEVRNFLQREPHGIAFDLVALNIQRGRDHGVGDYNTVRSAYGLTAVESFADISSDPDVQQALEDAYADVGDLDLWPAALAEDHVPAAAVGETLRAVISDQFRRLRDGDRFWFENDAYFTANADLLAEVRSTTLADIIRRNTPIDDELDDNVFVVASDTAPESDTESDTNAAPESKTESDTNAALDINTGSNTNTGSQRNTAPRPAPTVAAYVPPLCFY